MDSKFEPEHGFEYKLTLKLVDILETEDSEEINKQPGDLQHPSYDELLEIVGNDKRVVDYLEKTNLKDVGLFNYISTQIHQTIMDIQYLLKKNEDNVESCGDYLVKPEKVKALVLTEVNHNLLKLYEIAEQRGISVEELKKPLEIQKECEMQPSLPTEMNFDVFMSALYN
jgi:hypothetical protein